MVFALNREKKGCVGWDRDSAEIRKFDESTMTDTVDVFRRGIIWALVLKRNVPMFLKQNFFWTSIKFKKRNFLMPADG